MREAIHLRQRICKKNEITELHHHFQIIHNARGATNNAISLRLRLFSIRTD